MHFDHLKRRDFLTLLGAATAWPFAVRAQQAAMPVVGILYTGTAAAFQGEFAALRKGLAEIGFVEGKNVTFELRMAEGRLNQLPALAEDLVRRRVAVIFTALNGNAAVAAKEATTTIPTVFYMGADPVGLVVASLAQPGGNITGVATLSGDLVEKRLELLREIIPGISKIGYLRNVSNPLYRESRANERVEVARSIGVQLLVLDGSSPSQIESAFALAREQAAGAMLIDADAYFTNQADQIVALAVRYAMPTSYFRREHALAGGLFSYASDTSDSFRGAGVYIGRILKGASPRSLPVQQSTRFQLVVNLKAARQIGLEIPASVVNRADELIE